jgi:myo-inositol 2-dehydrogenase/D-chiro-inositol 1-dehydrogenase
MKGYSVDRRDFITTASCLLLVKPSTVFGYQANSAVRLGLLGCGSRGTTVAASFATSTTARVVALADIFPDKLASAREHFNQLNAKLSHEAIPDSQIFHGAEAFLALAQSPDVDLIQISTPPFFHVQHLEAAVSAGKHVYCEKPVGIDVQQASHALEIAKRVKPGQSVAVGFQCRNAPPLAEVARRIQSGALGRVAAISGNYNAPASTEKKREGAGPEEYRLRNWLWDKALSGDILVEQNIHIVDLANWMLGARPIKAAATASRAVLAHFGDCSDNYQVTYTYPDLAGGSPAHFSFSATQFGAYGGFDAGLKFFGSEGSAAAPYSGPVRIEGAQAWAWKDDGPASGGSGQFAANGAFEDNLRFADRDKERAVIESITSGHPLNEIASGVETALTCMMGRMAAYTGRTVTWDELLKHGETYELGFDLKRFA